MPEQFAVAQVFFTDEKQKIFSKTKCEANDLNILFFRKVPVNTEALGSQALEALPSIEQVFVCPNSLMSAKRFDALLYLTRKEIEHNR